MSGYSVQTITAPEFINVTSVSPLISKCEIKVLYTGENRNRSYITKEVAMQMAQSLPGTPIVGYYSENAEDFRDHGEQLVIDGDGLKFNCLTKPYGFVPTDTKVWFKEFQDTDEFGNKTIREYLMCEGYLWTEQYEEAKKVINEGRPHSMELDEKTLKGHWSTDTNRGIEFFIINDAIFSKLCILGEDVEPCFEGSAVTAPDVSSSFTLDSNEFKTTLFSMMKELKEYTASLNNGKGGNLMEDNMNQEVQVENNASDQVSENSLNEMDNNVETSFSQTDSTVEIKFEDGGDGGEGGDATEGTDAEGEDEGETVEETEEEEEIVNPLNDSEDKVEEEKEEEPKSEEPTRGGAKGGNATKSGDTTPVQESDRPDPVTEDEEGISSKIKELEEKYSLLEQSYNELQTKYETLEVERNGLLEFKNNVDIQKKKELIASFYMLSDEDKKDVNDNINNYSLDEIESKLAVICCRKKVSFEKDENEETNNTNIFTYNLNSVEQNNDLPAWLKAVEETKQKNI
jgi:hypothetical protein